MPKYLVEYKVTEPTWGDIELEAKDAEEADTFAKEILEVRNPIEEGWEVTIISVQELNAN